MPSFFSFSLFQVTRDVSLLSRWMTIDLYIREVDSLRFELSMNQCNDRLSRLAHEILEKGLGCLACLCSFQPQTKYSKFYGHYICLKTTYSCILRGLKSGTCSLESVKKSINLVGFDNQKCQLSTWSIFFQFIERNLNLKKQVILDLLIVCFTLYVNLRVMDHEVRSDDIQASLPY